MKLNDKKRALVDALVDNFGAIVTRKQALGLVKSQGGTVADVRFIFNSKALRAGRGQYDLSSLLVNGVDQSAADASVGNTSVVGSPTVAA